MSLMLPLLLHPSWAGDRDGHWGRLQPWDRGDKALPAPGEDSPGWAPRSWPSLAAPRVILGRISLQDISVTSV